jgi:hypothetical protein
MKWSNNQPYEKAVRLALAVCVGASFLVTSQDLSHAQQPSAGSTSSNQVVRASFQQMVAEIKKVQQVRSSQEFYLKLGKGGLFLAPSERELKSLLGARYPEVFTLGVAQRRATLSAGAKAVAEKELEKLQLMTQSQGGEWILQIFPLLQADTSCQPGIWSDGLSPLVEIPEAREVIQDYLALQLGDLSRGRKLNAKCSQPGIVTNFEQRLATDFYLLFLKTEPDPFEALSLYRGLRTRLSDKGLRLAVAMSLSSYLDTHLVPSS